MDKQGQEQKDRKEETAWTQLSLSKTRPIDKDNIFQRATEELSWQKEMSECYTVLWHGPCLPCFWLIIIIAQAAGALRLLWILARVFLEVPQ